MTEVYQYAEPVTAKGFVVMDTPGYDPVSVTGIVAGGAQRDGLHHRPRQLLRLQADAVDQGRHQHADVRADDRRHGHQRRRDPRRPPVEEVGREIFEEILAVASGKKTKSEQSRRRRGRIRPLATSGRRCAVSNAHLNPARRILRFGHSAV